MKARGSALSGLGWGELLLLGGILVLSVLPIALRSNGIGGIPVSAVLFVALMALGFLALPRYSRLVDRAAMAFGTLCVYAMVSALVQAKPIALDLRLIPLGSALVTMLGARAVVLRLPSLEAFQPTALRLSATLVAVTMPFVAKIPLGMATSGRLETSLGGAAVVHIVPLVSLGLALYCWKSGYLPKAALSLAVLSGLLILATGSRAGAGLATVYVAAVVVDWRRMRNVAALAVAVLVSLPLLATYQNGRLLNLADPKRATNYSHALQFWAESPFSVVFGAGVGRVWPWYTHESVDQTRVGRVAGVTSEYGRLLTNPHSVPIGVLVEMGVVGFVLLVVTLLPLVRAVRGLPSMREPEFVLVLLILVTVPAFAVDFYLLKNFQVSFVWWVAYFATLGVCEQRARRIGSATGDEPLTACRGCVPLRRHADALA